MSNNDKFASFKCPPVFCLCQDNFFFFLDPFVFCSAMTQIITWTFNKKERVKEINMQCFQEMPANNLPVLISAAGPGELALLHEAATQSIWEEARTGAKSSLYLRSGASQAGGCRVKRGEEELLYLWMLSACLPVCLQDATPEKVERAALCLKNLDCQVTKLILW